MVQRFDVGLVIERSLVRLPAGALSSQLGMERARDEKENERVTIRLEGRGGKGWRMEGREWNSWGTLRRDCVCMVRQPATSLITSSQPLLLLLAAAVYDLPTGTVSMCLAVDSARTAVGLSTMLPPDF